MPGPAEVDAMSGKSKLVLALVLVALIYLLAVDGSEPVEVEVDDEK
jgi:hypothetical protein